GGDQQFLERVDRIGVDGPRTSFRLIRALNDLLEPIDNLLFGASEAFPDASEYAHQIDLNLRRVSPSADLQVSPSAADSRAARHAGLLGAKPDATLPRAAAAEV